MFISYIFVIILIFAKSLAVYFVQDDFWLLSISQAKNITDFLNFFRPESSVVWYRPLSSQLFFFTNHFLFGLEPYYYRIVVFATHFFTAWMVYKLVFLLTRQKNVSFLAGFMYASHQLHNISLSWLAAYSFILGPALLVTTLYFYIQKKHVLAFLLFILGILCTEVLLTTPIILLGYDILSKRNVRWQLLLYSIPIALVLTLRFGFFPSIEKSDLYSVSLTVGSFAVFKFYLFRLLGVPLSIDAMSTSLKVSSYILTGIWGLIIGAGALWRMQTEKNYVSWVWFGFIGIVGILPFIFLPNHIAPHYLSFSLLGFAPLFALALLKFSSFLPKSVRTAGTLLLMTVFTLLQLIGSYWLYDSHWLYSRSRVARNLVSQNNFIHPVGSEEYFSLGGVDPSALFTQNEN